MDKPVIIGIAGGSASGKTAVAYKIYEYFKGNIRLKLLNWMIIIKISYI